MEVIFLDINNEKQDAHLIHQEKDYFCAYIRGTNEIVVGHPDKNITKDGDLPVIISYDHKHSINKIFNSNGECESYILGYFKNPQPIIQYVKTVKLIRPV